jgi:sugar phosphate isomerase/epimerase
MKAHVGASVKTGSDLREFARIGLVHHMLYPDSLESPDVHEVTLDSFVRRPDIETFDCCLPYGEDRQRRLVEAIKSSSKEHIAYAAHLFPIRKLSFATISRTEQAQVRLLVEDMIKQAAAIGATGFVFASGGPPFAEATKAHHQAFFDFFCWFCEKLAVHNIDALLEPFDFDFDKKFLYGPLDNCLELVTRVREKSPNVGIELDVAHLPLMHETFTDAIRRSAPLLKRVHLGNCVCRNPQDPFYGDNHPPVGYRGGEIDTPELTEILKALHEVGFLNQSDRGDLVLEFKPFPESTVEESVADNFQRLEEGWVRAIALTDSP